MKVYFKKQRRKQRRAQMRRRRGGGNEEEERWFGEKGTFFHWINFRICVNFSLLSSDAEYAGCEMGCVGVAVSGITGGG